MVARTVFGGPAGPVGGKRDSRGGIWCDLDGDGLLDLHVGGYERPAYQLDVVFRNAGKGGFELAWRTPKRMPARGLAAADYDEDGDIDVYVYPTTGCEPYSSVGLTISPRSWASPFCFS
jgi:hypothetical protein